MKRKPCPVCDGSGVSLSPRSLHACYVCEGSGHIATLQRADLTTEESANRTKAEQKTAAAVAAKYPGLFVKYHEGVNYSGPNQTPINDRPSLGVNDPFHHLKEGTQ